MILEQLSKNKNSEIFFTSWSPDLVSPNPDYLPLLIELDALKDLLVSSRPLAPIQVQKLSEKLYAEMTYNSNAIEGSSLTLSETDIVLRFGITSGGKPLAHYNDAVNHKKAMDLLYALADPEKKPSFLSDELLALHSLVLFGSDHAGQWRPFDVYISNSRFHPPAHQDVSDLMEKFFDWHSREAMFFHPVERAARLHTDLVSVHPFADGNGRTARLLANLELLRHGYPLTIIPVADRPYYYQFLETFQTTGDFGSFMRFFCTKVRKSFEPYWYLLSIPKDQVEEHIEKKTATLLDKMEPTGMDGPK
jgi:Fic family protein